MDHGKSTLIKSIIEKLNLSKEDDIEIPWDKIVKIGVDVIIVDATGI